MIGPQVYLDHAAGSPLRPEVAAAMLEAAALPGNPASPHGPGRRARELIERTRRALALRLEVAPDRIVFTSGGTEANNLALRGFPGPVLTSAVEHPSVLEATADAERIPAAADGRVDLAALAARLRAAQVGLVSVMHANNETGVVQPVAEVARLAHASGALLHCDAVQSFGKLPVAPARLGADLVSLSAHKLGGPAGVGALVLREGLEPAPLLRGGGQEGRRRAGTPNLPGIVGFGAALELTTDWAALARLRDRLERAVLAASPSSFAVGAEAERLPNLACLVTPGLPGEVQLMALDLAGIAVGIGAACSSGRIGPSHVLAAMGLPPDLARAAIRVSPGWNTGADDIERFVSVWAALAARMSDRKFTAS